MKSSHSSTPNVSIVMPAFNAGNYIRDSLLAISRQTEKNLEIIVVNDGSTDNTLEIVKEIASKDRRIKIVSQENGGLSNARNRGFREATGEYVMFLDSDDIFDEHLIEVLVKKAHQSMADVSICNFTTYNHSTNTTSEGMMLNIDDVFKSRHFSAKELKDDFNKISYFAVMVWNKMYKRSFLINNNIQFDESIYRSEDMLFTTKIMANATTIVYTDKPLLSYRINVPTSNVSTMEKYPYEIIEKTLPAIEAYLSDNKIINGFSKSFYNLSAGAVFSVLYNTELSTVHKKVYAKAKKLLIKYGALSKKEDDYYNKRDYELAGILASSNYDEWLARRVIELRDDEGRKYENYLLSEFKRKYNEEVSKNNSLSEKLVRTQEELENIKQSISWRVTLPLRYINKLINHGRKK